MYCRNCGNELQENAMFCTECGTRISAEPVVEPVVTVESVPEGKMEAPQNEPIPEMPKYENPIANNTTVEKKKSKKKKWVWMLIPCAIVAIAIIGVVGYFTSPYYMISNAIKSNDVKVIVSEYNNKVYENTLWETLTNSMVEAHVNKIVEQYNNGELEYEDASELLEAYERIYNDKISEIASEQLDIANTRNENLAILGEADKLLADKDYVTAIDQYEQLLDSDEFAEEAQKKIDECKSLYKQNILELTASPATSEEYQTAINLITIAESVLEEDADLAERKNKLQQDLLAFEKQTALDEASDAFAKGNYAEAQKIIKSALVNISDDEDLLSMLNKIQTTYETEVLSQVETYVVNKQYNQAIVVIEEALLVLSDSDVLWNKLVEVENMKPISITSLTPINYEGEFEWNEGIPEDPFGNIYTDASNYVMLFEEGYLEYRLHGDYSELSFTLAPYVSTGKYAMPYIKVYVDDNLIFTSDIITRKTDAIDYTIDVTNAEYIKIVIIDVRSVLFDKDNCSYLLLMNCELKK